MKNPDIFRLITSPPVEKEGSGEDEANIKDIMSFDFSEGFEDKVLARINSGSEVYGRTYAIEKSFSLAFYRIAFTAAAAVVILLLSIYLKEGSFSFDLLLGIGDIDSESIVCLLTGN